MSIIQLSDSVCPTLRRMPIFMILGIIGEIFFIVNY